ncbi:MAG: CDP-alcohol phosphatidyltransferase family protein [Bradymonadaceae bacterium]|nr:CDP-alcohol phosphatidyltransferase family protein [Lujinxingiaceae bacterium]
MPPTALIDTTQHSPQAGPESVVAGLSLVERTLRLARVCGCAQAVVVALERDLEAVQRIVAAHRYAFAIQISVSPTTDAADIRQAALSVFEAPAASFVWLHSSAIYDRGHVKACIRDATPDGPDCICDADPIATDDDARQAAARLWAGCRKPEDGIVSRHLNRHISLAISRAIAHTAITPNHISIVTFTLGIVAAVFAAWGDYTGFLIGALLYQINSVVDGVDGELARVKYEFSLLGEWLDTLSDDFSDLFFYIGLGVGAWRTVPIDIFGIDARLWLVLGGVAALAKLLSMALYYRWLIAHKRGDLLAFQWSFETEAGTEPGVLDRVLHYVRYLFRKDFIVFASMILAILGLLPWFLVLFAVGNLIVFISVAVQQLGQSSGR